LLKKKVYQKNTPDWISSDEKLQNQETKNQTVDSWQLQLRALRALKYIILFKFKLKP